MIDKELICCLREENKSLKEQNKYLKKELEKSKKAAITPQQAVDILRNANLVGILRLAADVGIEALEREMGGTHEAD